MAFCTCPPEAACTLYVPSRFARMGNAYAFVICVGWDTWWGRTSMPPPPRSLPGAEDAVMVMLSYSARTGVTRSYSVVVTIVRWPSVKSACSGSWTSTR